MKLCSFYQVVKNPYSKHLLSSSPLFYHIPIIVDYVTKTTSNLSSYIASLYSILHVLSSTLTHYTNAKCEIPQQTVETQPHEPCHSSTLSLSFDLTMAHDL